jgi:excisionase family DNA binding protein
MAWLVASDMREDLLVLLREIFECESPTEQLADSPDEAADLLGITREFVNDLLHTGQLGSVKAGRCRLIGKHHLEEFLKNSWQANSKWQRERAAGSTDIVLPSN